MTVPYLCSQDFHGERQVRVEGDRHVFRQGTQGHQGRLFFVENRRTDVRVRARVLLLHIVVGVVVVVVVVVVDCVL